MRAEQDNHPAQAYITLKTTIFHRQTGVDLSSRVEMDIERKSVKCYIVNFHMPQV